MLRDHDRLERCLLYVLSHPGRFFLINAVFWQLVFIYVKNPFAQVYHLPERFLHSVHLAYTARGAGDEIPASFVIFTGIYDPQWIESLFAQQCDTWRARLVDPDICTANERRHIPGNSISEKAGNVALDENVTIPFASHRFAGHHFFLGYMPFTAGVWLASVFGFKPLYVFYAGMLTSATLLTFLAYYCIQVWPVMRWSVCFMLLLPYAFKIRLHPDPDALTIELSFLLTGLVLRYIANPELLQRGKKLALGCLGVAVSAIKFAYLMLLALLFMLPVSCFVSRRAKICFCLGIIIVGLACDIGWAHYAMQKFYHTEVLSLSDNQAVADDLTKQKLHMLITQPFSFLWAPL